MNIIKILTIIMVIGLLSTGTMMAQDGPAIRIKGAALSAGGSTELRVGGVTTFSSIDYYPNFNGSHQFSIDYEGEDTYDIVAYDIFGTGTLPRIRLQRFGGETVFGGDVRLQGSLRFADGSVFTGAGAIPAATTPTDNWSISGDLDVAGRIKIGVDDGFDITRLDFASLGSNWGIKVTPVDFQYSNFYINNSYLPTDAIAITGVNNHVGLGKAPSAEYRLDVNGTIHADALDSSSYAFIASGAVHIGPYTTSHSFSSRAALSDAYLFVEEGIATEDMTYIFAEDWDEWPDYVFEESYDLNSLSEVESYIRQHKHLPGVISQEEVKEKGVSDKQMNVTLLKKVEELTLYAIEQDKALEAQQVLNSALLEKLKTQQQTSDELLKRLHTLEAQFKAMSDNQ